MKILVLHGWLQGNLGDLLQTSVLLKRLRSLNPSVLHLSGFPTRLPKGHEEILTLIDNYLPDLFAWGWSFVPCGLIDFLAHPKLHPRRAQWFQQYDVILSAPGPFLTQADFRFHAALRDISLAKRLKIPFILSSHSIGPLQSVAIPFLKKVALCFAREEETRRYLQRYDIPCVPAADYAFLYPTNNFKPLEDKNSVTLFLRGNNFSLKKFRRKNSFIFCEDQCIADLSKGLLRLATTDSKKDWAFLEKLSSLLGIPLAQARTISELTSLIMNSSEVISDRYHPLVIAHTYGKKTTFLCSKEKHKMHGLQYLTQNKNLSDLKNLALSGLDSIAECLRNIHFSELKASDSLIV